MLLQEVLLDADADMTAATLKTKLDTSGQDARQDHAHNPLPPSQDKQPDLAEQSQVQAQQVANTDTHFHLQARDMESEQGEADSAACMKASHDMGNKGAFQQHDLHSGPRGPECQTGNKAQHSNSNTAVNIIQSTALDSTDDISCLEDIHVVNA